MFFVEEQEVLERKTLRWEEDDWIDDRDCEISFHESSGIKKRKKLLGRKMEQRFVKKKKNCFRRKWFVRKSLPSGHSWSLLTVVSMTGCLIVVLNACHKMCNEEEGWPRELETSDTRSASRVFSTSYVFSYECSRLWRRALLRKFYCSNSLVTHYEW